MSRFVDRGAITAAWVGVGMAVTIGVSFLLVIPIEFLVTPFALFAGLLIGYYANARSNRAGGPWPRILANSLLAGVATGVTFALLLLLVKVIFFFADTGYPDFNRADADGNKIPPYLPVGRRLRLPALPRDRPRPGVRGGGRHGRRLVHAALLARAVRERRRPDPAQRRRGAGRRADVRPGEPPQARGATRRRTAPTRPEPHRARPA